LSPWRIIFPGFCENARQWSIASARTPKDINDLFARHLCVTVLDHSGASELHGSDHWERAQLTGIARDVLADAQNPLNAPGCRQECIGEF
jgi:hypothetical protein